MYSMILDEGCVIRDSDQKIIAPCQSIDEPEFAEYIQWADAGNQPTTYNTRSDMQI